MGLRRYGQGWTDIQVMTSLMMLNLAGGESVMDLDVLEEDEGFCRVLRQAETYRMHPRERRALEERWRVEPSAERAVRVGGIPVSGEIP